MGRIHLFEFEDQSWFPGVIRNFGTDFLQYLANRTNMFEPIISKLEQGLKCSEGQRIIDLCSGGGGGLLSLNRSLQKENHEVTITLTDLYPNIDAFETTQNQADNFAYVEDAVDARHVPAELKGLRTMFLSFHHFKPSDARQILQNAVDSNQPIGVFEAQERSVPSVIAMLFSPVTLLLTTPFIRPFRFSRILFSYLIPIVPLFVLWDGVVSALRTYSVKEMEELVQSLESSDRFNWESGRIKSGPGAILYLLGTPKQS